MYQVFAFLDNQFKAPLESFISSGTSNISTWVAGPLTVALVLYVVLYGYLVLRGSIEAPVLEFAYRAIKLAILVMLVRNAADYRAFVTDLFFTSLPQEISTALNSGAVPSASTFDALLDKGQASATQIWNRSSWPLDIATAFGGLVMVVITFIVAAIGYVVSLYARVALAIILALGPIFIALAMFQSTRRFTEAWIGQLVNYVILQILVVAVGSLLITTLDTSITTVEAYEDVLMRPIAIGAIGIASLYVFYQLPGIAASLAAGGASLTYGYSVARDAHDSTLISAAAAVQRTARRGMGAAVRRLSAHDTS
ncbi:MULTISPECIES: type IV secretion system protein [unclassified Ensifer]|uniref:type IV secretion system protein n=1 Tax=unclassified Ensifer TaxID=2633371 RepID=UPI000812D326|nr:MULTISPECIES: type IV secretion system protein [unclassified Ensifer]OCP21399.1 conjugal transfer protein TrbL [Ensifer sp. LC54]OCP26866.1 conjugal transfer protein TrbL [Ensifer sp. LC384]